jgi:magnesium-transporting ATPase (P-type)
MAYSENEKSQIRYARLAGFMYLFTYPSYLLGLSITGRFEVPGNFAETAHRIMGAELLYRFGLSCQLITCLCCMVLAMGLYVAVKPIDKNLALFALLFRMTENILGAAFSIITFAALKLYLGVDSANGFDAKQLSIYMGLLSTAYSVASLVGMIFLGMGSILFFYLFLKSKYIPKIISAWGVFASVLATIVAFACLYWPQYSKPLELGWAPIGLAEISVGLWLLIKGLNLHPRENRTGDIVAAQSARN